MASYEKEHDAIVDSTVLPPDRYKLLLQFSILGHLPRKSNSRIAIVRKGKPRVILSKEARDYNKDMARQVTGDMKLGVGSLKVNLAIQACVFYRSRRSDLSIELFLDTMQREGIIKDDRYVVEQFLYGYVDKHNPRVNARLYEIIGDRIPLI